MLYLSKLHRLPTSVPYCLGHHRLRIPHLCGTCIYQRLMSFTFKFNRLFARPKNKKCITKKQNCLLSGAYNDNSAFSKHAVYILIHIPHEGRQ